MDTNDPPLPCRPCLPAISPSKSTEGVNVDMAGREPLVSKGLFVGITMNKQYFIYILTNKSNTALYTGITNDLKHKVNEHRMKKSPSYSGRCQVNKLVYYEMMDDIYLAILRQKQIQVESERKKVNLINNFNGEWRDLYDEL